MMLLADIAVCVVMMLNVWVLVYHAILTRRLAKLNRLLGTICIHAFIDQHAPYWRAWSETYGHNFEVRVSRERN